MARWSCRTSACSRGVRDRTARLWQADGTAGPVLRGHEGPVGGALELQDQRLLTWSDDGTARLWQADGTAGPVLRGHERIVNWRAGAAGPAPAHLE